MRSFSVMLPALLSTLGAIGASVCSPTVAQAQTASRPLTITATFRAETLTTAPKPTKKKASPALPSTFEAPFAANQPVILGAGRDTTDTDEMGNRRTRYTGRAVSLTPVAAATQTPGVYRAVVRWRAGELLEAEDGWTVSIEEIPMEKEHCINRGEMALCLLLRPTPTQSEAAPAHRPFESRPDLATRIETPSRRAAQISQEPVPAHRPTEQRADLARATPPRRQN